MKIWGLLFTTCFILFALTSCNNDEEPDFKGLNQKYVKFEGSIESQAASQQKASNTTWDPGDAIGVYMKTAGTNLSAGSLNGAENIKYTTPGDGQFDAATTGIELPSDGSNVDFIAYYPYQTTINNLSYPIDVSNQTDLSKIDLLYSNNATGKNKNNPTVDLNFKHMLSQLIINITAGDGVSSLTGLNVSINDLVTEGSFNLADASVTLGSTKTALSPVVNSSTATSATVNAILIPGDDLNNGQIIFTLNGKVYEWTPDTKVLESGKKYTYPIQLTTTGLVVLDPSGNIEDWTEGNTGGSGIVLTPSDNDVFLSDKANVSLAAAASSSDVIQLTTQSDQAWTAASSESWLTISPASGTGNSQITLTAQENTGGERTATVTLTATGSSLTPVTVSVTQEAAGSVVPGGDLVFTGSDFEDWTGFTGILAYPIQSYATQSLTGGRNGSSALYINGTVSANQYVFTAQVSTPVPSSATKIELYLKGTATGKSLSFNVYSADAPADGYYKFNLGDCNGNINLDASSVNGYGGSINTNNEWVKVTLDITGYNLNATGNIFALKTGKDGVYDLYVDDITFE